MPFANEIVSEADIEKHGLDDLMAKYDEWNWRSGRPSAYSHSWTIDRDRGVFIKKVKTWHEVGRSGRPEPTSKATWVIDVKGHRAAAVLDRAQAYSPVDSRYRLVWSLVHLELPPTTVLTEALVLPLLKEALVVYGVLGVFFRAQNTDVSFSF